MDYSIYRLASTDIEALYVDRNWLARAANVTELVTGALIYTAAAITLGKASGVWQVQFDLLLDRPDLLQLTGRSLKSHTLAPYFKAPLEYYGVTCKGSRSGTTISGNALTVLSRAGNTINKVDTFNDIRMDRRVLSAIPGRPGILYSFIRSCALNRTRDRKVKSQQYIIDSMPGLVSRNTLPAAIDKLVGMKAVSRGRCYFNGMRTDTFSPVYPDPFGVAASRKHMASAGKPAEADATVEEPAVQKPLETIDVSGW